MSTFTIGQVVTIVSGAFASYEATIISTSPVKGEVIIFGKRGVIEITPDMLEVPSSTKTEMAVTGSRAVRNLYTHLRGAGYDRETAITMVADEYNLWRVTSRDCHGEPDEVRPYAWVYRVCRD